MERKPAGAGIKKSGGARTREQWAAALDELLHRERTSIKNTDTARHKGYDADKKISGIKRHIAVDTQGLPHAITMTTAEVNDRNGALLMLLLNERNLSEVQKVLVDGSYTGERFEGMVWQILGAKVEIAKRNDLHKFTVIPKRRIVERSFAWLEKCRRLWKNCERKLHTSEQFRLLPTWSEYCLRCCKGHCNEVLCKWSRRNGTAEQQERRRIKLQIILNRDH